MNSPRLEHWCLQSFITHLKNTLPSGTSIQVPGISQPGESATSWCAIRPVQTIFTTESATGAAGKSTLQVSCFAMKGDLSSEVSTVTPWDLAGLVREALESPLEIHRYGDDDALVGGMTAIVKTEVYLDGAATKEWKHYHAVILTLDLLFSC